MGLMDTLGICVFPSEDTDSTTQVEFTQGRANITLPFKIAPEDGQTVQLKQSGNLICLLNWPPRQVG
jgi:hypothetical protein